MNRGGRITSYACICEIISELTGQMKCRKAVSTHLQIVIRFSVRIKIATRQSAKTQQASDVISVVLYRNQNSFTYIPDSSSKPLLKLKESVSLVRDTILPKKLFFLSLVNRFYRIECFNHLLSNLRKIQFDFGSDRPALQQFGSTAPAEIIASIRHVRITLVEGYMPQLPSWSDLRTLAIDLWPRDPSRLDPKKDRAWGVQTEALLAGLGATSAVGAKITLEMRWLADCERFEREYVAKGWWRRVTADAKDGAPDQERELCRRCYELCGNKGPVVRAIDPDTEMASAIAGLVL